MIATIKSILSVCPKCNSALTKRQMLVQTYFVCTDCKSIYKIIGKGNNDDELLISDYNLEVIENDGER